jgi:hypothetical protein
MRRDTAAPPTTAPTMNSTGIGIPQVVKLEQVKIESVRQLEIFLRRAQHRLY